MPREIRKRGKKHKKSSDHNGHVPPPPAGPPVSLLPPVESTNPIIQPFGLVDPDLKAYFRTIDTKLQEWTLSKNDWEESELSEEKQTLFRAALQEMAGKELSLATDPDCSIILERMLHSMDDFTRRVFMDSLTGSYFLLAKHRFGSHVCQTCFELTRSSITREMNGQFPKLPDSDALQSLRTVTQLVTDAVNELIPHLSEMVNDQFATHVFRRILLLLNPALLRANDAKDITLRSRKSTRWKDKQGSFASIFSEGSQELHADVHWVTPPDWESVNLEILRRLAGSLSDSELKALAVSPAGCPTLQLLIRAEAMSDALDFKPFLEALLYGARESLPRHHASDFVRSLIRDATGSHLLECIIGCCPNTVFLDIWETYFSDQLPKLAVHPVSNFLIGRAIERLPLEHFRSLLLKLDGVWQRLVQSGRGRILIAIVCRTQRLPSETSNVSEVIKSAFNMQSGPPETFIPRVLSFRNDVTPPFDELAQQQEHAPSNSFHPQPTVQGAILLQSLLQLDQPCNAGVLLSLWTFSLERLLELAQHPIGSRILDAVLDSETVPQADKKRIVLIFIGKYHELVDDKIGSRIGDRCWRFADLFLREKIGRSLLAFEKELMQSYYGKFFARSLDLPLLRRSPGRWKEAQRYNLQTSAASLTTAGTHSQVQKRRQVDEIDDAFQRPKSKQKVSL